MKMKLYLVRGHDVDGENQDWFVVAPDVERCVVLWNDVVVSNGLPRRDGDEEDSIPRVETVDPANIREILPDVSGTPFDGSERAVEWDELAVVS